MSPVIAAERSNGTIAPSRRRTAAISNSDPVLSGGGDWLFRHGELILGPVPAAQIVERLNAGELDGKTEVQLLGGDHFRRISEVEFFRVYLAKAEAKQRVDAHERTEESAAQKRRLTRITAVVIVSVLFAGAAGYAAIYLAIHRPWKTGDAEALAELISVEPPTITLARSRLAEEELLDYPGGPKKPLDKLADRGSSKSAKSASTKTGGGPKLNSEGDEPDGLQTAKFDQEAINAVVATKQKTLYPCLVAEAQKKPGLSARIPIEFVIGNGGKVNKVWVDHPDFKTGSLPECLLRELQKWQFKAFEGEQPNVGLSFKIGKG